MIPLISMGLGAIGSLSQLLTANRQQRAADRMQFNRPVASVPSALNESVAMARQSANAQLPGLGMATNNLRAATANGARSAQMAGSSNNALAAIAAMNANEANGMNQLAAQQAQYNTGQRNVLMGQLGQLSNAQQQVWDWNQKQDYLEKSASKSALTGSAIQNRYNGITGLAGLGMQGLMGMQDEQDQEQQQANNVIGYHQNQLSQMRNTPLFGGLQSRYRL